MSSKSQDLRGQGYTSKFRVNCTNVQWLISGAVTLIQMGSGVDFDLLNEIDNILYQFVPLKAGYYFFHTSLALNLLNVGDQIEIQLRLAGLWTHHNIMINDVAGLNNIHVQGLLYVTPNDTVTVYGWHNSGVNRQVNVNIIETVFEGFRIG